MELLYALIGLICGYAIYAKGIKDGKAFAQGKPVEIIPNPIKVIQNNKESKEAKAKEKKFEDYQDRLMDYDGFKQSEKVGG